MQINGYQINYSEEELRRKMTEETLEVKLISPQFEGYLNLSEGNQKALRHLIAAARMINDVTLEQDHPLNLSRKRLWKKRRRPETRMQNWRWSCLTA